MTTDEQKKWLAEKAELDTPCMCDHKQLNHRNVMGWFFPNGIIHNKGACLLCDCHRFVGGLDANTEVTK